MKKPMKHIEKARKVYDRFWDSYQSGDIDSFASTLDENFEMIGTSESEICHSKEEGIEFYKGQLDEVVGKAEMRYRYINELPLDGQVLINEMCDLYTLQDTEWTFYSKLRISTLLRETSSGWKVAQQHCSIPDLRVQEGETLAIEKITKENLALRDAVKRRTAELENKNRELEIEAATQRVRAAAMAMQKPDDIMNVLNVIKAELEKFELQNIGTWFWIFNEDKTLTQWDISETGAGGSLNNINITVDLKTSIATRYHEPNWHTEEYYNMPWRGTPLQQLIDEIKELDPEGGQVFQELVDKGEVTTYWQACAPFSRGVLGLDFAFEPPENVESILKKMASSFDMAYRRFEDLQKAEKHARESEIEASLERVRAKGLAMHSTDEIESATAVVFNELSRLGIKLERCGITLMNETPVAELWSTTLSPETKEVIDIVTGYLDFRIHPLTQKSYRDWKEKKKFSTYYLVGDELQKYYEKIEKQPEYKFPKVANYPDHQVLHTFFFNEGALFVYTTNEMSDESKKIVHRFTKVFEQTYTRFLDIQRAEKLAFETARQSSLDRIRAEIASMRSSEDLNQITPIIWDELNTLEIPFIRCGVFIIDEEKGISHTYLSTSEGEPIAALHLPIHGISLIENAVEAWRKRNIHTEHWDKQDFRDWTQNLIDRGFIDSKEKYEAGSAPETLDLHFLPFKHGMLYIGNTEPLSQEKLDLGQSMADAFSVAYDRYEDFNKLEQAKLKIEEAFEELEAAKDQLVQQEKLASLGQLTAGIAHEIKNPLNFVNNFSDLSIELVEEAREEIKEKLTADSHQLTAILDDIETNLKTIHKHGTRADGIVKSMLQHSRGGSGKMEPTDVNALIKEYANLAYHGMRAGKDPIDVEIMLDLDKSVGKVEMIGEDFSRVILNLCNNAFDAMREKLAAVSRQQSADSPFEAGSGDNAPDEYEPKLSIRTHKNKHAVRIEIQDNGPGIPDEIKDKILQPFFTTKKGTAGTGLGLSITNDIIKAHGGILEIESDQEHFTRFTIQLSAKNR